MGNIMKPTVEITEDALRETIAQFMFCKPEEIGATDDFSEDLGLDSIDRLDLLTEVELRHSAKFSDSQISSVSNLKAMLDVLREGASDV